MNWRQDYIERAHDYLRERLLDGKTVNGLSLADLMDCDFQDRTRAAVSEVYILLASVTAYAKDDVIHGARRARVYEYLARLADEYLKAHPDVVREQAAEMMHTEEAA